MFRLLILSSLVAGLGMAQSRTGLPLTGFEDVDAAVQQVMSTNHVPGVSLAIVKDGRLVLARGYGLAETESTQPMQPDTLVRWNSISKTVTAVAILKLVEQGKLNLDDPAFNYLQRIQPTGGWGDSQIQSITIRQLLEHAGGWDSTVSGEPITSPLRDQIAAATGGPFLPTTESTVRYMIAQKLDFDPGTHYAYSTLGYMILGLVIAEVTGQPYEQFMRANIFEPVGTMDMHIAGSFLEQRLPDEAHYYAWPGAGLIPSTLLPAHPDAPLPYATLDYPNILAGGGWLGSVLHLAKFVASLDGQRQPALIQPASLQQMLAAPAGTLWLGPNTWYGLGIAVFSPDGLLYWSHPGSSPGSRTNYVHLPNGVSYEFLANSDTEGPDFNNQMTAQLSSLCLSPRTWPDGDLFFEYFAPHPAATVSAASFAGGSGAPDSLLALFGSDLASSTESATTIPLPQSLGAFSARLVDSSGTNHPGLPLLYASGSQVNFHLPPGVALGPATLYVKRDPHPEVSAPLTIAAVAPGLFMANTNRLAAAVILRFRDNVLQSVEPVTTAPIRPGNPGEEVFLSLYGTGIRGNSGLAAVTVHFGGSSAPALYAGPQGQLIGLDQVNVKLTSDLGLRGPVEVSLVVDGVASNSVILPFE